MPFCRDTKKVGCMQKATKTFKYFWIKEFCKKIKRYGKQLANTILVNYIINIIIIIVIVGGSGGGGGGGVCVNLIVADDFYMLYCDWKQFVFNYLQELCTGVKVGSFEFFIAAHTKNKNKQMDSM